MKQIVGIEKTLGDSGKVQAQLGVQGENLVGKVTAEVTYPIIKVVEPATKALDSALDKLEKAIPGDWDKPLIEKIKAEYKEELVKLLAE